MKILFVCKANFGRSQIAEAIFNSISKKHQAVSAAAKDVRVIGHKLQEFPEHSNLFICMDEIGIDLREKTAKLLTPEMIENSDKVIVMAEKNLWPDFLKKSNKTIFWEIDDMAGQSLGKYQHARDEIKKLVKKLLEETE